MLATVGFIASYSLTITCSLSCVINQHQSHKLTYGSSALRRWPRPQHGMKGTREGRNWRPSHRLPVRQQHLLSLGPCLQTWPTGLWTTKRCRADNEDSRDPWWKSEQRAVVSTPAPYFCPPLLTCAPYLPPYSETMEIQKSDSNTPCSSSSSSTHLQTVAAECPSEFTPPQNLCTLWQSLCAAKSSAALLCCGRDVQLQAGTLVQLLVDLDPLITTRKFLLGTGRRWSSECPLLTAVPCFLIDDTSSIFPAPPSFIQGSVGF